MSQSLASKRNSFCSHTVVYFPEVQVRCCEVLLRSAASGFFLKSADNFEQFSERSAIDNLSKISQLFSTPPFPKAYFKKNKFSSHWKKGAPTQKR